MWSSLGFRVNSGFTRKGPSSFPLLATISPGSSHSFFIHSGSCLEVRDAAGCLAWSRGGKQVLELFAPGRLVPLCVPDWLHNTLPPASLAPLQCWI